MVKRLSLSLAGAMIVAAVCAGPMALAQGPARPPAGFNVNQAIGGKAAYDEHCASCHGADLAGSGPSAALRGPAFLRKWADQPPGADVSMLKIRGTEIQQALTELAMQAADPAAHETQALERRYLDMRKTTIYAGSNEIQRNIIAKMTLGL